MMRYVSHTLKQSVIETANAIRHVFNQTRHAAIYKCPGQPQYVSLCNADAIWIFLIDTKNVGCAADGLGDA